MWIDLRDAGGRLLARYDPARRLLEIQRRGVKTLIDLTAYEPAYEPPSSAPSAPASRPERPRERSRTP
jgi:hypothetical protein